MLPTAVLELRQDHVLAYLHRLPLTRGKPWLDAVELANTLPERLALLHPHWLEGVTTQLAVQGAPAFTRSSARATCRADLLWGYDCPLAHEAIQADHVFPYSLGGPSTGSNRLSLCRVHNSWKGADLANFPWELGEPDWLADQLGSVRRVMRTRR